MVRLGTLWGFGEEERKGGGFFKIKRKVKKWGDK